MFFEHRQALAYMNQRQILHIDMLEALRHQRADLIRSSANGVLVRHRRRDLFLLSAADIKTAADLMTDIKDVNVIVVRQSFCQDLMNEKYGLDQSVPCIQHAYLDSAQLQIPDIKVQISPLTADEIPFVLKHYSLGLDQAYIEERIANTAIYGLFAEGTLAGFAGFHSEGSLGMLEIIPAFRRRGFAYYLQSYLTNLAVKQNRIPYTQIKDGNLASLALQKKCYYQADPQKICWMMKA